MRTKRFWHIAIPLCIALWTAFIWGQSLVPAEKSTADSQVVEHFFSPKEQQVTVAFGECHNLCFNAWTISWAYTLYLSVVQG